MGVRFDTYYKYDELTAILKAYAGAYPGFCRIFTMGQSPEGRELWMVEITNCACGVADAKPGFYIDGNTHAGEVTGSAAYLYTIHQLLTGYASCAETRATVDGTVFYIRPRVSPDGAELYLTTPNNLRSVPRPYPTPERQPGLHPEDMDGDGWITLMRIADPNGDWKVSDQDPRFMVARGDDESGGTYYRLCPEGRIYGPVDATLKVAPAYWGMDLNRNYPANWQPEHVQKGSGKYPLSEPETRASADFILNHPNIAMIICYHTHGHFVFRPPSSKPAKDFSNFDINVVYKVLGDKYEEFTGGPVRQSYDEKTGSARIGSLMDWAYQHLGIVGWVPELWAWGKDYDGDGKISELDYLRWNDEELGGNGFVNWRSFEHPQLGPVEIGGWKTKFTSQNPPGKFLEPELKCHHAFTMYLARSLPRVVVSGVAVQALGADTYRVTASVKNTGLLPTNLVDQAFAAQKAKPVRVSIALEGLELLHGAAVQTVGHLPGRISRLGSSETLYRYLYSMAGPMGAQEPAVDWVVKGKGQAVVTVVAEKAGTAERVVSIP
ncbi:MAG: M14 family metallopeptidase [Bacillota bacterium]|nr:M14 family metallopeptidase [Bacillota bacterium]